LNPPETFETERLLLRTPSLDDADTIFQLYTQDKEVLRYLTWRPHTSVEMTRSAIHGYVSDWELKSRLSWIIVRREDKQILGMISMRINRFEAIL
jgi:[ribosomal protein S5]-alanine N-acetyltransferase